MGSHFSLTSHRNRGLYTTKFQLKSEVPQLLLFTSSFSVQGFESVLHRFYFSPHPLTSNMGKLFVKDLSCFKLTNNTNNYKKFTSRFGMTLPVAPLLLRLHNPRVHLTACFLLTSLDFLSLHVRLLVCFLLATLAARPKWQGAGGRAR